MKFTGNYFFHLTVFARDSRGFHTVVICFCVHLQKRTSRKVKMTVCCDTFYTQAAIAFFYKNDYIVLYSRVENHIITMNNFQMLEGDI